MLPRLLAKTDLRITVITVAALGVAAIGAAGAHRRRLSAPAPVPEARIGAFHLGEQIRNQATVKLRLALGGRAAPQEIEIAGDWAATPTDGEDGLALVACALSNVRVRLGDRGQSAEPAPPAAASSSGTPATVAGGETAAERELGAALAATPFFVAYEARGAVAGFWFPRGTNPGIANLFITLAGAQQLVRGAAGEPAWVVEERDANGRYLAAYRERTPGRFEKRKARYLEADPFPNRGGQRVGAAAAAARTASSGTRGPTIRIDRSDFDLLADAHGRLLELRATEALVLDVASPGLALETTVDIELAGGRAADGAALIGAFARGRDALQFQPVAQMATDPRAAAAERDRRLLAGAGLEDLRRELAAHPAGAAPSAPETRALVRRFQALFRTDAAAAAAAPALVRAAAPAASQVIVDALSLADTPASGAALGAVAVDPAAPIVARQYAVQYVAHLAQPPEEAVRAVTSLIDDPDAQLRQMARLSAGACAQSLRPAAPARARIIVDDLLARLGRAASAADRADFVMALGSAGDAAALPVLRGILERGDLRQRAGAVDALRFIDAPEIEPLLVSLLGSSPDDSIRLAAIGAIRARAIGPFASALADVARQDPSTGVRNAAVALLGDRLRVLPTLRPILETVQEHDAAPRNRQLAARYLDL